MTEETNSDNKIAKLLRMIESAESSLKAAHSLLAEIAPDKIMGKAGSDAIRTSPLTSSADNSKAYDEGETQIVEGLFDGQNMIGPGDKTYPVPANYASKSKLVEGDKLKLTIKPDGSFLYKQIEPIERKFIKGILISEDGQFRVTAEGKTYKVILASVTYYKGTTGDEVTIIVPSNREAEWAAIEAIIPQQNTGSYNETESF